MMQNTRKLKIMHFAVSAGGVKRHVLDIAAGSDRERFETIGVFPDRSLSSSVAGSMENRYRACFAELGLECHVLEVPRELSPLRDLSAVFSLAKLIRRLKPDVLHCHSSKAGLIGRVAARLGGCDAVCFTPQVMYYTLHSGWRRAVYLAAEKVLAPVTDATVAVSQSEFDDISRDFSFGSRLTHIPNGVLPQPLPADTGNLRRNFEIADDDIFLLSPTRCEPQKDVRTLLLAMSRVHKEEPRAKLVVAGEGPQRAELQILTRQLGLEDCVRFAGWVDDMPPLMAAADVIVLSSVREGMPYAILEASAMGKPVIGSRVIGTMDCIQDGRSGYLVPCGDAGAFAEKILQLCGDAELRARLGAGGISLIDETFHRDLMVGKLEALYEGLARRGR